MLFFKKNKKSYFSRSKSFDRWGRDFGILKLIKEKNRNFYAINKLNKWHFANNKSRETEEDV